MFTSETARTDFEMLLKSQNREQFIWTNSGEQVVSIVGCVDSFLKAVDLESFDLKNHKELCGIIEKCPRFTELKCQIDEEIAKIDDPAIQEKKRKELYKNLYLSLVHRLILQSFEPKAAGTWFRKKWMEAEVQWRETSQAEKVALVGIGVLAAIALTIGTKGAATIGFGMAAASAGSAGAVGAGLGIAMLAVAKVAAVATTAVLGVISAKVMTAVSATVLLATTLYATKRFFSWKPSCVKPVVVQSNPEAIARARLEDRAEVLAKSLCQILIDCKMLNRGDELDKTKRDHAVRLFLESAKQKGTIAYSRREEYNKLVKKVHELKAERIALEAGASGSAATPPSPTAIASLHNSDGSGPEITPAHGQGEGAAPGVA